MAPAQATLAEPRQRRITGAHAAGLVEASPAGFARGLVRRPRLVDKLLAAPRAKLVLLVAPAGYGKSTLLYEWANRDPRPFIWLRLDDPGLRRTPDVIDAAIGELEARNRSLVAVIDQARTVPAKLMRRTVTRLLRNLPDGSTVAIAARAEPALAIGRLRAHRELVELRIGDLAMRTAEAATLLRRAGLKLEPGAVEALVRDTEGWPAALYLAALSLRDDPGPAGTARFGGDDHLVSEFLHDEVLSSVPADLTGFLRNAAVLEELSGPLCDEVLDQHGSGLALARLAKLSQLLVPLDHVHERYRCQRLVAGALRAELRRAKPELEPRLLLRASSWYERRGDTDRAIDHAVGANDAERTGDLLWGKILTYLGHGSNARVERWLSTFSHDRVAGSLKLALCAAYVSLAAGDVDHATHWTVVAEAALEREPDGSRLPSARTGLEVMDALLERGGAAGLRRAVARAERSEAPDSQWRPMLNLLKGVAEHLLGEREVAAATLSRGADLSIATAPSVASLCLAVGVMIAIEQGDWDTAAELNDRAGRLVQAGELATYPVSALVFAASAAVRAHQGRVDEAKHDLRRGIDLLSELGDYIPWYGAEARILLGHASLWLADVVGARALLADASRLAHKTPDAVIFSRWFDQAWEYMDSLAESSLSGPSSLTIAELRVLRFLPSHRSFREIAEQLGVSANTVKTQAHAVYRKLGAASRSEAVARAVETGLLGH
jgi:LuxR family maltose regulon positive regulatory protein